MVLNAAPWRAAPGGFWEAREALQGKGPWRRGSRCNSRFESKISSFRLRENYLSCPLELTVRTMQGGGQRRLTRRGVREPQSMSTFILSCSSASHLFALSPAQESNPSYDAPGPTSLPPCPNFLPTIPCAILFPESMISLTLLPCTDLARSRLVSTRPLSCSKMQKGKENPFALHP